jgi:uncharacterized protein (DUF362 family)/Pyruvate/2-oxoacid:ferredoxin oxidoreductase delta subunit
MTETLGHGKFESATGQNNARVSIVRADDYNLPRLVPIVQRSIELIGGLETIIKPGDRVFVKINHLPPPSPPERGIVTHPVFAEAVLELLKKAGAEITVGDEIESTPVDGFSTSGFRQMCQRAGVRLINLREEGFVARECNGLLLKEIYLSKTALAADVIVNLPKLKTHSLTVFTGGVKNMYGTIPGNLRSRLHGEYPDSEDFSKMLTDIFSVIRPQLTLMDGIVAMEGEGPSAGSVRKLGVILASRDAVSVDAIATGIIGMDPMDIATTRYAHERGLGVGSLDSIEVVGESIKSVATSDFRFPISAKRALLRKIPAPLSRFAVGQLSVRPKVVEQQCTACAECVRACPTGAITIHSTTAAIDRSICIECMCCHEVCRFDAMVTARPLIGSAVSLAVDAVRKLLGN